MADYITAYEASKRAGLAVGYVRQLLMKGKLKGRRAKINDWKAIWLVEPASLKQFIASPRKPGPKPKKK